MQWLRRRVRRDSSDLVAPIDVTALVETAQNDTMSVQRAIRLIEDERRALQRRRASIDDQFHRMTPQQLKTAVRTRAAFPQLERNMLTDALQGVDAERERQRAEQIAAIDDRLRLLEGGHRQLNDISRSWSQ